MNPFATLGLAPGFSLSPRAISERKVELSRTLHPDRHVGRPAVERRAALGKALEVNEAARRLEDEITRAEALLELMGCSISEDRTTQPDPSFLMEIMELRQELREVGLEKDVSKIEKLHERMEQRRAETVRLLGAAFDTVLPPGWDGSQSVTVDDEWRDRAHQLVGELRYFRRFSDEAEGYLDEIV